MVFRKKLYALVWTTTPWTLPGNKAICYNPKLEYSIFATTDEIPEYFLFSKEAFESSELPIDNSNYWEVTRFSGNLKFSNKEEFRYFLTYQFCDLMGQPVTKLTSTRIVA